MQCQYLRRRGPHLNLDAGRAFGTHRGFELTNHAYHMSMAIMAIPNSCMLTHPSIPHPLNPHYYQKKIFPSCMPWHDHTIVTKAFLFAVKIGWQINIYPIHAIPIAPPRPSPRIRSLLPYIPMHAIYLKESPGSDRFWWGCLLCWCSLRKHTIDIHVDGNANINQPINQPPLYPHILCHNIPYVYVARMMMMMMMTMMTCMYVNVRTYVRTVPTN